MFRENSGSVSFYAQANEDAKDTKSHVKGHTY